MTEINLERKQGDAATLSTALYSRINWGAVIAGLVIALGLQLVLGLAGAAIRRGKAMPALRLA